MKLYLVGHETINCGSHGLLVRGIFDTKEKAIAVCTDASHFWAEVELNEDLGIGESDFKVFDWPIKPITMEYLWNNPDEVLQSQIVYYQHTYNCVRLDIQEGLIQLQHPDGVENPFWTRCENCNLHKPLNPFTA